VQEALSGLPGIKVIEVDLSKDTLRLRYDAKRVTPQQMLEVVGKKGFQGKIVSDGR